MAGEGILGEIVARTLDDCKRRVGRSSIADLRQRGESRARSRLSLANVLAGGHAIEPRFICETKKASPSKGLLLEGFDAGALARAYVQGEASAISVVTEPHFFQGSPDFLEAVREETAATPLLRKDFHVHELQIYETAASPADALLFIVAVLSPIQLKDYLDMAQAFRLGHLVEVTTPDEAETALKAGAQVIGVNNRDLRTFEVDVARTTSILPLLREADVVAVAESGIRDHDTVEALWSAGVDAFLVGEALVTAGDPAAKLRELRGLLDTD